MASEWIETIIGDHIQLATGEAFQSAKFGNNPESGTRLARGDNVKEGKFEWGDKTRYWPEVTPELERYLLREGDVILGMDGSKVGKNWVQVKKNDLPCLLVQRVARLRAKESMDQRFLRYLIGNPNFRDYVERVKTGTSIPHISGGQIKSYRVTLPPIHEQKVIAEILGALDDKIELNGSMNKTLEAMAQTLYQRWFVDATQAGLPKGWRVRALGEVLDVKHGYAFEGEYFRDQPPGDILLTPGNFAIGGGFKDDKLKYFIGPVPDDFVLNENDLLVTMTDLSKASDTLGYPAAIPSIWAGHRFLHNQRLGKIVITEPSAVNKLYLYRLFCGEAYRNEILAGATGTTVKHTSPSRIKAFKAAFPPPSVMASFGQTTLPWNLAAAHNRNESRTLAALRDTLLPKLLSGELRVKEAYA